MSADTGNILVVDDHAGQARAVAHLLRDHGHSTEWVTSGMAALAVLSQWPVDVIVLDYLMPGMDGAAFVEEALRRGEVPPVVVMTGFDRDVVRSAFDGLPIVAVVVKGAPEELVGAVARGVEMHRARQATLRAHDSARSAARRCDSDGAGAIARAVTAMVAARRRV